MSRKENFASNQGAIGTSTERLTEPADGFALILQRTASILLNISERNMMKVLQIGPEDDGLVAGMNADRDSDKNTDQRCFSYYLGNARNFDLTGIVYNDMPSLSYNHIMESKRYNDVHTMSLMADTSSNQDPLQSLELRAGMFQCVINIIPPVVESDSGTGVIETTTSVPVWHISHYLPYVSDNGYMISSMPEEVWQNYEIMDELEELQETDQLQLLSIQVVNGYYLCLTQRK